MERIVIISYYTVFCILTIPLTPARKLAPIFTRATVDTRVLGTFELGITLLNFTHTSFLKNRKNCPAKHAWGYPPAFVYLRTGENAGALTLATIRFYWDAP